MVKDSFTRTLELQRQLEEAKQEAIRELLEKRAGIDKQLAELGHSKPCKVCGEYGHDARSHRLENLAKKKTAGPLKKNGGVVSETTKSESKAS